MMELFLEGVYQFGDADNTGLAQDDFDISAYAFSADLALNLDDMTGFGRQAAHRLYLHIR